ncbi:hypothetical protein DFS34DRAFT_646972 [Phlyctochytrium arcticum]|nr:hypothetical protein DFS34DRAFT_646972 [Phlyctochytrium arcticum]
MTEQQKKAIKPFKWNLHAVPFVPAIKEQAKEDAAPAAEPAGLSPEAAEFVPSANRMPTHTPAPIPPYIPTLMPAHTPQWADQLDWAMASCADVSSPCI